MASPEWWQTLFASHEPAFFLFSFLLLFNGEERSCLSCPNSEQTVLLFYTFLFFLNNNNKNNNKKNPPDGNVRMFSTLPSQGVSFACKSGVTTEFLIQVQTKRVLVTSIDMSRDDYIPIDLEPGVNYAIRLFALRLKREHASSA